MGSNLKHFYTDQEAVMGKAVAQVFAEAWHRLCTFYIMKNVVKHLHEKNADEKKKEKNQRWPPFLHVCLESTAPMPPPVEVLPLAHKPPHQPQLQSVAWSLGGDEQNLSTMAKVLGDKSVASHDI